MKINGHCLCGTVAYEAVIDPDRCAICHCTDCQTHSGSAFGVVVHVRDGAFALLSGELKIFTKTAESGRRRELSFCPECGTRIHARTPGDPDAFFGLRVGTIDQRHQLRPRQQVWCRSAAPWVFELAEISRKEDQG